MPQASDPSVGASAELQQYQRHIQQRLKQLTPVFAKAMVGDFSAQVPIGDKEDELSEFFVGVQIILDAIREKIAELEASMAQLQAANDIIASEKARVEAILDGLGEGLITLDANWRTNYVNGPAIAMLGPEARILGQEIWQVLHLEDAQGEAVPDAKHPIAKAIRLKRRVAVTMTTGPAYFVRSQGLARSRLALTVTPILRDSKMTGAAIALRDITEESNIDWAKSEIISIASHQLRTPLTAIKWYVAALLREEEELTQERTERYLTRIQDANQHMINLVDALLNVSRLELGTLTLKPKAVKLPGVVREVLKELAVEIDTKNLAVTADVSHDLRPVFIDTHAVHIILQNLVSNAVKYSGKGGSIFITVKQQATNALVTVQDQGCGIPAGQQHKIFTKLFRATNAAKVATDGTGLGLYVTKALLERAGGAVWFESEEGKGSTFYAIIPSES